MAIKRCKSSFAVQIGGAPRVVPAGALLDESDPVIKGREAYFEDVETYVSDRAPKVEQATAEPGERRSVTRPARKRAAAKKPGPPTGQKAPEGSGGSEGDGA